MFPLTSTARNRMLLPAARTNGPSYRCHGPRSSRYSMPATATSPVAARVPPVPPPPAAGSGGGPVFGGGGGDVVGGGQGHPRAALDRSRRGCGGRGDLVR